MPSAAPKTGREARIWIRHCVGCFQIFPQIRKGASARLPPFKAGHYGICSSQKPAGIAAELAAIGHLAPSGRPSASATCWRPRLSEGRPNFALSCPILHTGQLATVDPPLMKQPRHQVLVQVSWEDELGASPPVVALPWYARGDYPALLKLFSDPDKLPATYDGWLKRTELTEKQFQKAGFGVARIWVRPRPFAAWCKERNVSPDQAARLTFANESARNLAARR